MDIEKLNKSQIILLTLLCSFVTSIATGIVTVSLMDQAPPAITQTLEHVVERTVQVAAPASADAAAPPKTVEKTVLVKESDLVPQAVAHMNQSTVRLYAGPADALTFIGLGVVVSTKGMIATDLSILPEEGQAIWAINQSGVPLWTKVISRQRTTSLALMQSATSTAAGPVSWRTVSMSTQNPALGESVNSITGRTSTRVGQGIVSGFASSAYTTDGPQDIIDTNITRDSYSAGSPLFDSAGNLLGISTSASRDQGDGAFIASSDVLMHIKALSK